MDAIENGKRWESVVQRHFAFLSEFGFCLDHVDEKWWATSAVYLSDVLGVEVTRSVEFRRVELTLMRLVDARAPEVEVWLSDTPLDRVLFDNVLEARAPEQLGKLASGLSDDEVEEQHSSLRRAASDGRPGSPRGERCRHLGR